MSKKICGVLPVFQMPFTENESIDFATLEREIDWLFEKGVDGVTMALASETLRLSTEERMEVAEFVCRCVSHRSIAVISVGTESTVVSERLARHAENCGATAIMAVPPITVSLGEADRKRYYERLIESVDIPFIIQDASSYVGTPMTIALQAELMNQYGPERVLFKPEANPLGPKITELINATSGKAQVFEGSGGIALVESYRRGGIGTMPAADLIEGIVPLWTALESGDEERVERIRMPITAIISMLSSIETYVVVEKYLLKRRGVFPNTVVRQPVGFTMDEQTRAEIDRLFDLMIEATQ